MKQKFDFLSISDVREMVRDNLREVTFAVWHCTATKEHQEIKAEQIDAWHKVRGFSEIGYHFVVKLDGTIQAGRPITRTPASVQGHNSRSIALVYVGGIDSEGQPKDTRTPAQMDTMMQIQAAIQWESLTKGHGLDWFGHRDFSKDLNGDGIISSGEWMKSCPCFDVQEFTRSFDIGRDGDIVVKW